MKFLKILFAVLYLIFDKPQNFIVNAFLACFAEMDGYNVVCRANFTVEFIRRVLLRLRFGGSIIVHGKTPFDT